MDTVVDPETGAVVDVSGRYAGVKLARGESIRQFWVGVADTYDAHELIPMWAWTVAQVKRSASEGMMLDSVVKAASHAMACAMRCCGGKPESSGEIKDAYDRLPVVVGWRELQAAVEDLACEWEAVDMPWATDSEQNQHGEQTIVFTQVVDCEKCGAPFDVEFDTGARDEDGLTDLEPGDLEQTIVCPNPRCGHSFAVSYTGWSNYGDAG